MTLSIWEQTFCIYCQVEHRTPAALQRHLRRKHKGTYAEVALSGKREGKPAS